MSDHSLGVVEAGKPVPSPRCARRNPPSRPWRDRLGSGSVRAALWQVAMLGGVLLGGAYLSGNLSDALTARGMSLSFDFLDEPAGFSIGESPIPFTPASTFADAFLVGVLNALKVFFVGITLATILGVALGIARNSSNALLSRLAGLYVEAFRNTPQLVQIAFWYTLVTLAPPVRQAIEPLPGLFVSNRGVQMPWLEGDAGLVISGLLVAGLIAAFGVRYRLSRPSLRPRLPAGARRAVFILLVIGPPLLGWLALGMPSTVSVPQVRGFNFAGGLALSAEFVALTLGLSLYIAAFIAEIVRSGLQSVSRGQIEAAQSIGLSSTTLYFSIIIPQAARVMIPPLSAQYISLMKNSSLGIAVGYPELFNISNTITTITGRAVECTTIMMSIYLLLSLLIGAVMGLFNKTVQLRER